MIVDDDPEAVGRAIGGHARAAALTKEERREVRTRARAQRRIANGVQLCGAKTRQGQPCIAKPVK